MEHSYRTSAGYYIHTSVFHKDSLNIKSQDVLDALTGKPYPNENNTSKLELFGN